MTTTRPSLAEMIRPNFKRMQFYKSARGEFTGQADTLLDANENPYDTGHNRYPDPMHRPLRAAIAKSYGIAPDRIFIGNGSSEAIDLLMRLVCRPGQDRIVQLPPTFGLYQVDADLNDIEVLDIPLDDEMNPIVSEVLAKAEAGRDRILFLCTPNNPVGNDYPRESVMQLVEGFPGLVVIDQAYIEFSDLPSYRDLIDTHPHVIVMETMSKAYGLAGSRVGLAFGDPELIEWLNNVKPPYNVPVESAEAALQAVAERESRVAEQIEQIRSERDRLAVAFAKTQVWSRVYPTNANFFLVAHPKANALYDFLCERGIIVRNQTGKFGSGHLRITVGTPEENDRLLEALDAWQRG
jgi:histidinol-phosphate aminotransferase